MELQIIRDKNNSLLKRREITVKIQNKTTPSRIEVKNKLAAIANSKPELIVIEHLDASFGKQEVIGVANIYENEERLKQLAHNHLIIRGVPKATEAAESAPEAKPEVEPKTEEKK